EVKNDEEESITDDKQQPSTQNSKKKDTPRISIKPLVEQKLWLFRGAKNIKLLETYYFPTCPDNVKEFLVKLQSQIR
ncbi:33135_t:CDS:1, partial [Racocetra persica]